MASVVGPGMLSAKGSGAMVKPSVNSSGNTATRAPARAACSTKPRARTRFAVGSCQTVSCWTRATRREEGMDRS